MRQLTDTETKTLFEKLANYTGRSLNALLTDTTTSPGSKTPDRYVFRVQKDRVYYVRESLANLATSVARDNLLSLGTCMGKFTKTGKFRLHITALDVIAPHARYKVWVKPNGEMPFLYGGHVVKAHVGRWSEECPEHQGVVVMSMNDTPLVRHLLQFLLFSRPSSLLLGIRCNGKIDCRSKTSGSYGHRHLSPSRCWRIPA
jgi:60S ribosome subunit biogenesis protein NIP7